MISAGFGTCFLIRECCVFIAAPLENNLRGSTLGSGVNAGVSCLGVPCGIGLLRSIRGLSRLIYVSVLNDLVISMTTANVLTDLVIMMNGLVARDYHRDDHRVLNDFVIGMSLTAEIVVEDTLEKHER